MQLVTNKIEVAIPLNNAFDIFILLFVSDFKYSFLKANLSTRNPTVST